MNANQGSGSEAAEVGGLRVVPPATVERWRREDAVDRFCRRWAAATVRLCWWAVLFFAGYVAALVIGAGGAA